jgi:hypothetical protein
MADKLFIVISFFITDSNFVPTVSGCYSVNSLRNGSAQIFAVLLL